MKILMFVLLLCSAAWAANPYDLGKVQFFAGQKKETAATSQADSVETADLPLPVLLLLNSPTKENAKNYLNWQRRKFNRIKAAQLAIKQAEDDEL